MTLRRFRDVTTTFSISSAVTLLSGGETEITGVHGFTIKKIINSRSPSHPLIIYDRERDRERKRYRDSVYRFSALIN